MLLSSKHSLLQTLEIQGGEAALAGELQGSQLVRLRAKQAAHRRHEGIHASSSAATEEGGEGKGGSGESGAPVDSHLQLYGSH